ncbi:Alpha crystallin/Hsp20 domain [Dillenia turbinata]|uniref:Alpha crystallin/Hsp20 domain n=1 Tax=Dillenia turbinata TaxID=194707 RepID=A0AAN8ZHR0_9MAGN
MSLFPSPFERHQTIFDPFRRLVFLDNEDIMRESSSSHQNNIPMNWKETSHSHIFEFYLPGLTKDDVKLQVHQGRLLHISGERKEEEEEGETAKEEKWHCKERISGRKFFRQFRLPVDAKVEEIKAEMHDGLLVITVPRDQTKMKKGKNKGWQVEVCGDDDEEANARSPKGLGRFVCCKA